MKPCAVESNASTRLWIVRWSDPYHQAFGGGLSDRCLDPQFGVGIAVVRREQVMNTSTETGRPPDLSTLEIAAFAFSPRRPVSETLIVLDVLANTRIENKQFVCELRLYGADGVPVIAREPSWPFSSRLKALYQYLPQVEGRASLQLKTFKMGTTFSRAVLGVRPWGRQFKGGEFEVKAGFATERCVLGGRSYVEYHALERLGSTND